MSRTALRFALFFFGGLLAFSAFAAAVEIQNQLGPIERFLTRSAAELARLAGGSPEILNGNVIVVSQATLLVNHECTGLFVLVVLACFILAYPAKWRPKLIGLAFGVSMLSALNVVRIATLVRLAEFYPSLLEYFHEYVWQGVFLMLVTLYAMSWVERARA